VTPAPRRDLGAVVAFSLLPPPADLVLDWFGFDLDGFDLVALLQLLDVEDAMGLVLEAKDGDFDAFGSFFSVSDKTMPSLPSSSLSMLPCATSANSDFTTVM
jgi:hypothetical protein